MSLSLNQLHLLCAPKINYIYILLILGCIGAKLGGLYHYDAKMDTNCVHFNIPNKLHLILLVINWLGAKIGTLYKDFAKVEKYDLMKKDDNKIKIWGFLDLTS